MQLCRRYGTATTGPGYDNRTQGWAPPCPHKPMLLAMVAVGRRCGVIIARRAVHSRREYPPQHHCPWYLAPGSGACGRAWRSRAEHASMPCAHAMHPCDHASKTIRAETGIAAFFRLRSDLSEDAAEPRSRKIQSVASSRASIADVVDSMHQDRTLRRQP